MTEIVDWCEQMGQKCSIDIMNPMFNMLNMLQDDDALREFTSLSQEKMDEILLEAWTDLMLNLDANNLFLRKLQQVGILDWSTANTVQVIIPR